MTTRRDTAYACLASGRTSPQWGGPELPCDRRSSGENRLLDELFHRRTRAQNDDNKEHLLIL